jgi:hypothetical protein
VIVITDTWVCQWSNRTWWPMATVLFIDDHTCSSRKLIQTLRATGYAVCVAVDADEAIRLFRLYPVDIVMLDCRLCRLGNTLADPAAVLRRLKPGYSNHHDVGLLRCALPPHAGRRCLCPEGRHWHDPAADSGNHVVCSAVWLMPIHSCLKLLVCSCSGPEHDRSIQLSIRADLLVNCGARGCPRGRQHQNAVRRLIDPASAE